MKKHFLALATFLAATAQASNYPPSYSWQTAHVVNRGPVMFALVSSGIGSTSLWGYKSSGVLARTNPDHIDAVVTSTCKLSDGSEVSKKTTVGLGREWHGTGYMTIPMTQGLYGFYPDPCRYQSNGKGDLQIAFSDGNGNWDSLYGQNYRLNEGTLSGNEAVSYATGESGPYNGLNQKAWDFLIDQMRK